MKFLWKRTVSAESMAIRPTLCRNCAFRQNLHTRQLREIKMFHAVTGPLHMIIHPEIKFSISNRVKRKYCRTLISTRGETIYFHLILPRTENVFMFYNVAHKIRSARKLIEVKSLKVVEIIQS